MLTYSNSKFSSHCFCCLQPPSTSGLSPTPPNWRFFIRKVDVTSQSAAMATVVSPTRCLATTPCPTPGRPNLCVTRDWRSQTLALVDLVVMTTLRRLPVARSSTQPGILPFSSWLQRGRGSAKRYLIGQSHLCVTC